MVCLLFCSKPRLKAQDEIDQWVEISGAYELGPDSSNAWGRLQLNLYNLPNRNDHADRTCQGSE